MQSVPGGTAQGGVLGFRVSRLFSTIHGQITAVIFACLIIAFIIGSTLESWVREEYSAPDMESMSAHVSAIASVLAPATPGDRDVILAAANHEDGRLTLQPLSYSERFTTSSPDEPFLQVILDRLLPPENHPVPFGGWRTFADGKRVLAAQVDNDTLLVMELPESFLRNDALIFGSNYLVATVTLLILFSVFAVGALTSPLRRIASAAMKADISLGPAIFEERGSSEIVTLARALNGMQRRISTMVESRTRMLRGISHDLRTPLTRLRLRAERVQEDETREGLLGDIERIDRLLKESLGYLRDNHQREVSQRADLGSMLQTTCDEFADMGHDVQYSGPARMVTNFKPLALTRAITNLCENAIKFGTHVKVELRAVEGQAVIDISDDGPGIPEQYRTRVLEPFFKVDTARQDTETGFGLGLSIVAEIVQAHHGKLVLLDRQPNGLVARIILPLEQK
ncbi:signal transduction histidine kinase [Rhizobium wenxiniae]|uniref:histidine kinase n=1 Tax=Rhizobium wenxiniae TaxID=1737357 RepID=A0A7X0D398_9HYPH|nr:ATP-binding protein [Rhizobium wenxiniae]MBB6165913.1 signal transduction histidine kinase [Rhizobium wenxiniae]